MLVYALIARSSDGMILVESTAAGIRGNHVQITNQLLQKLTANPHLIHVGNRKTYSTEMGTDQAYDTGHRTNEDVEMKTFWNGSGTEEVYNSDVEGSSMSHFFHVQRGEAVLYVCISDDAGFQDHQINFEFLLDIQKEFSQRYTPNKILKASAYGMERQFGKTLANIMHYCNTHRNTLGGNDKQAVKLNAQVESIRKVLNLNINLMIQRGDALENLIHQSEDLLEDAQIFRKSGKKLKRAVKKKALFYKLILVGFGLLLIYLMMVKLCGFDLSCEADNQQDNDDDGGNYGYN